MFDIVEVGARIRDRRKERGLTQDELAEIIRVSPQAVSKWERGLAVPEISNLKEISRIFGVSVDYLIANEKS